MIVLFEQPDRISCCDLSFLRHRKVKAGSAALQEDFDRLGITKSDAKFVARHARLGHNELGRSNSKSVADVGRLFQDPFRREIFSQRGPG